MSSVWKKTTVWLILMLGLGSGPALAQDEDGERELGWSNTTDLSFVLTDGNSAARTLGFANRLRRVWPRSRLQVDLTGVRSGTSDDRFFLVDPGFVFPVGGTPDGPDVPVRDATADTRRGELSRGWRIRPEHHGISSSGTPVRAGTATRMGFGAWLLIYG